MSKYLFTFIITNTITVFTTIFLSNYFKKNDTEFLYRKINNIEYTIEQLQNYIRNTTSEYTEKYDALIVIINEKIQEFINNSGTYEIIN